jgi:hypothetical protein
MYRQGLGDCYLLTFFTGDAQNEFHMLIDCGSIGAGANGKPMKTVIEDIHRTTKGHIHLLVVTHEHEDHVSGFNVSGNTITEDEKKSKLFEELFPKSENGAQGVDKVWLAWTEGMTHQGLKEKLDISTSKDVLKKDGLHSDLEDWRNNFRLSAQVLNRAQAEMDKQEALRVSGLLGMSAFEGSPLGANSTTYRSKKFAYTVDEGMDTATRIGKATEPRFLEPGAVIDDMIPDWRFYVLGPPQDRKQLQRLEDESQLYHFAKGQLGDLTAVLQYYLSNQSLAEYRQKLESEDRQKFNACFPFDDRFRREISDPANSTKEDNTEKKKDHRQDNIYGRYFHGPAWRRIDYDWLLGPAESLALQIDNYTNNTSLVLAIENVKDKSVLLFPGDAQLGNWETWDGTSILQADGSKKEGRIEFPSQHTDSLDLLARTVFYKVGHHSSHNATTIAGLERMTAKWKENDSGTRGLVAMISLDSETAANKGEDGWNMPEPGLYEALLKEHKAHVLRSDIGWPAADEDQKSTRWYQKNFKQDDSVWKILKAEIESYRSHILGNSRIEKRATPAELNSEQGELTVCIYTDPGGKFTIQYEVDPNTEFDDATRIPKEIPEPKGNYIDYYMC